MIFAITRRAYPREVLRFSAIARSVMIFATTAPVAQRRSPCRFSAIARSVMIFAELRDALRAFEWVSVL